MTDSLNISHSPPAGGARNKVTEAVIYQEIYNAILDHRLPPGTKLREDAIGEIFGVSRTVVRAAIGRLGHENIVEIRPYRSAIVSRPSVKDARDVFRARIVIEDEIVRQACQRASDSQLAELQELVRQERKAFQTRDRRRQIRLSGDYHLKLAQIGGNEALGKFLGELVSRTSLIIALYQPDNDSACASDEHAEISALIAARDADAAVASMRRHLEDCLDNLRLVDPEEEVDLAEIFQDFTARQQDAG